MSAKKTSSFGNPKPLPGQANYGMSEAELLERQTREMEARLKGLQQKMQETAPVPSAGAGVGTWKSARPDKGSVTSYAKDVQEKIKTKKVSEKAVKATAEGRRMARKQSQAHFTEKSVEHWSVNDVSEWLESKNLTQYIPNFMQNEINGSVLVDISLEDLDYMDITILGHRKTILKGIEEISSGKKLVASCIPSRDPSVSASVDCEYRRPDVKKPVHWSQLEPIAKNEVSEDGVTFINPADLPMDEAAERRAFQEAVTEWRNMGQAATGGMWSNPIADSIDTNGDPSTGTSSEAPGGTAEGSNKGASLAYGTLDEEKEREEFAKAVAAWRNAGKTSSEGTETAVSDNGVSGETVAEKLAKSMEEEHERVVLRLQEEQEVARRKIAEAARELEIAKQRKLESEMNAELEAKREASMPAPGIFNDSDNEDRLSEASADNDGDHKDVKHDKGGVVVSLVESTLGLDMDIRADEKGCQYDVEEPSDDEGGNEYKCEAK